MARRVSRRPSHSRVPIARQDLDRRVGTAHGRQLLVGQVGDPQPVDAQPGAPQAGDERPRSPRRDRASVARSAGAARSPRASRRRPGGPARRAGRARRRAGASTWPPRRRLDAWLPKSRPPAASSCQTPRPVPTVRITRGSGSGTPAGSVAGCHGVRTSRSPGYVVRTSASSLARSPRPARERPATRPRRPAARCRSRSRCPSPPGRARERQSVTSARWARQVGPSTCRVNVIAAPCRR